MLLRIDFAELLGIDILAFDGIDDDDGHDLGDIAKTTIARPRRSRELFAKFFEVFARRH